MSTSPESSDFNLGFFFCPSGSLLLMDPELLPYWSYAEEPTADPVPVECWDLEIVGPDAWQAGQEFHRQPYPLFLFDIPDVGRMTKIFSEFCAERRLQATCRPLSRRVPHRERLRLSLENRTSTLVQYVGMWAVGVGGLPRDRELRVLGEPMPPGEFEGRWRRLILEVESGEVCSEERLDGVMVDHAQLLFGDADFLDGNCVALDTSWGDGVFPVVVERGGRGQVLRLRVELGDQERRAMLREVLLRGVEAVLSREVEEGKPIQEAERLADGHWLFTTGEETEAEMVAPDYFGVVDLQEVLTRNPELRRFMLRGHGTVVKGVQGEWMVVT